MKQKTSLPPQTSIKTAQIALLSPPYSTLTYSIPPWPATGWTVGTRVAIPLGKSLRAGIILSLEQEQTELPAGLRPMLWPLEKTALLSKEYLQFIEQLAVRQVLTPGRILGTVLPAGLRSTSTLRLRCLPEQGTSYTYRLKELAQLPTHELANVAELWKQGRAEFESPQEDVASLEICVLNTVPPWPVKPNAKVQIAILDYLTEKGSTSRRHLLQALGARSATALKTLQENGLIRINVEQEEKIATSNAPLPPIPPSNITLAPDQETVYSALKTALDTKKAATHLLYGVTGSGKTVVYLELARHCLQQGRSVLLLAPEIALSVKLYAELQEAFPNYPVHCFHGSQTATAKKKIFADMAHTTHAVVLAGTRSALFLPIHTIGLIVLDEEHDGSFKQDERLVYQAKELAWFLSQQHKALLLLGSATPDIKTYYATKSGKIPLHNLPTRVHGGTLPSVELVDIRHLKPTEGLLAEKSLEAVHQTIEQGEQVVILLNRRGYAPIMYCLDCGSTARCPHCAISLTYHKGRERLVCHYCDYSVSFPTVCSQCKGLHFLPMGEGTEKLEENLQPHLPVGTRILRLDRDNTRRPGSMENILEQFATGKAEVLVGTQMLSKGHHFPNVTLALVADGDLGLNIPDYHATERTFQLLVQSSGRSGRGDKPGKVLIQTRNPEHYCWPHIVNSDYIAFYQEEIAKREQRRYPPFTNVALFRISFPFMWEQGEAECNKLAKNIRELAKTYKITVLGPAPAYMPLVRGQRRYQCLLKATDWPSIRTLYKHVLQLAHKEMRISLDLDPVNMN